MSNFKQYEYKHKARVSTKDREIRGQQQWLEDRLTYLQKVEEYNLLIKEIFVCHKCGKRITKPDWVYTKEVHSPGENKKIHYYHSKRQCNPQYNRICLYCGKSFRIKRKTQKLCSKKCSVNYMTSPILIRQCSACGKEFKIRLIKNNENNEKYCPHCR
ncbi:MAG: hypothetical protein ACFFB5_09755 [Promethearchaeota archaeon]